MQVERLYISAHSGKKIRPMAMLLLLWFHKAAKQLSLNGSAHTPRNDSSSAPRIAPCAHSMEDSREHLYTKTQHKEAIKEYNMNLQKGTYISL